MSTERNHAVEMHDIKILVTKASISETSILKKYIASYPSR